MSGSGIFSAAGTSEPLKCTPEFYTQSDIKQFYLNVKRGDILEFNNLDCYYHYGVFLDEGGLGGTSSLNIAHLKITPSRVEYAFLTKLSAMAKSGVKKKSEMLTELRKCHIDKIGINSIEDMFLVKDRVKIDNELNNFWKSVSLLPFDQFDLNDLNDLRPFVPHSLLKFNIGQWIENLKKHGE